MEIDNLTSGWPWNEIFQWLAIGFLYFYARTMDDGATTERQQAFDFIKQLDRRLDKLEDALRQINVG